MAQNPSYSIHPLTDRSLIIRFGDVISKVVHEKVMSAYYTLQAAKYPFVTDLVPAYSTLGVVYSLTKANDLPGAGNVFCRVEAIIKHALSETGNRKDYKGRQLKVPVCYEPDLAPDIVTLATSKQLSVEEVTAIHCSITYDVYMLGFLPGFAYMGLVDDRIAAPRLKTPRTLVPKGSVGIAGHQTGIYPGDSPGGWQLIGRTPLQLFEPNSRTPAFFLPGDEVTFYPITRHEFENY